MSGGMERREGLRVPVWQKIVVFGWMWMVVKIAFISERAHVVWILVFHHYFKARSLLGSVLIVGWLYSERPNRKGFLRHPPNPTTCLRPTILSHLVRKKNPHAEEVCCFLLLTVSLEFSVAYMTFLFRVFFLFFSSLSC